MDSERIEVLDDLLQLGGIQKSNNARRAFRHDRYDELKKDIEQEKETREIIVNQIESFTTSHHPVTPSSSSSSSSLYYNIVIFSSVDFFRLFSELFLVLIESCRYEVEFLRKLFRLSSYFELHYVGTNAVPFANNNGTMITSNVGGKGAATIRISMKSMLQGLHIWNNIPFWVDTVHDLTRFDILVIEKVYSKLLMMQHQQGIGEVTTSNNIPFLGLQKSLVIALTLFTRIQAVVGSMRSVGLGRESVDSFVQAVNQKYKLEEYGFELSFLTASNFTNSRDNRYNSAAALLSALTLASGAGQLLHHTLESLCQLESQISMSFSALYEEYETAMIGLFQQEVTQATSSKGKKKFQLNRYGFGKLLSVYDIGHTILIPLLLFPAISQAHQADQMNSTVIVKKNKKGASVQRCICGDRLQAWKLCGVPTVAEIKIFQKLQQILPSASFKDVSAGINANVLGSGADRLAYVPSALCECCYRSVFADPTSFLRIQVISMGICPLLGSTSASGASAIEAEEDADLDDSDNDERRNRESGGVTSFVNDVAKTVQLDAYEKVLMKIYYDVEIVPSPTRIISRRISPIKTPISSSNKMMLQFQGGMVDADSLPDRMDAVDITSTPSTHPTKSRVRSTSSDSGNGSNASGNNSERYHNRPLPKTPFSTSAVSNTSSSPMTVTVARTDRPSPPTAAIAELEADPEVNSESQEVLNRQNTEGLRGLDDGSVYMNRSESPSVTVSLADVQPLSPTEFQEFFKRLWRGTTVNVVYSMNPLVEKTRLLFFRSDSSTNNDLLVDRIKHHKSHYLVDWIQRHVNHGDMVPLFLGWAHRSEAANLSYDPAKSLPLQVITNVKIGSKKFEHCIKITSDAKTIVIKIEGDEEKLQLIVRGLTQLAIIVSRCYR